MIPSAPSSRPTASEVLKQTLWNRSLLRAMSDLRRRHPEASLEVAAVETALATAARDLLLYLETLAENGRTRGSERPEERGSLALGEAAAPRVRAD